MFFKKRMKVLPGLVVAKPINHYKHLTTTTKTIESTAVAVIS